MPLRMSQRQAWVVYGGIVARRERDRGKREKLLLFSEAEEAAEMFLVFLMVCGLLPWARR